MQNGRRPLDGIRVLELASIVAGPFCGGLMAEFGAEVIKTEMPGRGDDIRRMGPREDDVGYWWALEKHQVPYSRIMTMADIFADPHYRERDMIIDVPHPTLGALPQPGVVPKLSGSPGRVTSAGAALGEHTDEILGGLLGLSREEMAELRQEDVI